MNRPFALLSPFLLFAFSTAFTQPDPKEIVRRADEKARGDSHRAEMVIETIRPGWTREMRLTSWSKGDDYGVILITAPDRDEGTAFLKRDREIWNWLPSIERTVKLPPSMMMQDWMGTDFKNDDLVNESSVVGDYTHELLGTETLDGREAWKIRMIPKPEATVVWGEVITWIDTEEYINLRTEDYDEDGELVNTLTFSDIRELGGRTLPSRMTMVPADKPGHKTILRYESLEFGVDIEDRFFTVQYLRRLRG